MFHLLICNIHIQTALYPPMYHVLHVFSTFLIHTHRKQQKLKKIDAFSLKQNSKFFEKKTRTLSATHKTFEIALLFFFALCFILG